MKKIMYCASTFSHINNFHLPYIKKFKESGYEIIIVAGGDIIEIPYATQCIQVPFEKKLTSLKNLKNINYLRRILKEFKFDVISVHTSLAAALVRIALFLVPNRPYVINTVHGYLFGESYGKVKNTLYLWIEKILKIKTDSVVVMNNEDYQIAQINKLYKKELHKIDGMGVDLQKLYPSSQSALTRRDLGFETKDVIMIFVGEFSMRKNQIFLIESLKNLPNHYKLLLVGTGEMLETCKNVAKENNVQHRVVFAGYQLHVIDYYRISDICVSASRSEGLPFNIIEAMACGLPVVASDIKGHQDLIEQEFLFTYDDSEEFTKKIKALDEIKRQKTGERNIRESQKYDIQAVLEQNYKVLRWAE